MTMVFYPNYIAALGGSEALIGMLYALNNAVFVLFQIPGGFLADRVGRKRLVVSMTWLIALDYAIIALAPSWQVLMIAAVIDGASRMYVSALHALLYDSIPENRRASAMVLTRALPSLVAIPAPFIGGIVATTLGEPTLGYRTLFIIASILAVSAASLRLYLKETIKPSEKLELKTFARSFIDGYRGIIDIWRSIPIELKALLIFIGALPAMASGIFFPYLVRVAKIRMGLSDAEWGSVVTLGIALSSALTLAAAPLLDRIRYHVLISLGLSSISIGLFAMQFINLSYAPYIALSLIYIGRAIYMSGYASSIMALTPLHQRGRVSSLDNVLGFSGYVLGNIIGSILFERLYEKMFLLSITIDLALAFSIIVLALYRQKKTFQEPEQ